MSNPNTTWFDNIRWKELAAGLSILTGILTALQSAPLDPETRQWVGLVVSVLSTLLAFLRNPKKLEWEQPKDGSENEEDGN